MTTPQTGAARAPIPPDTAMQRAEELVRQMTIEEKAMQLSSVFPLALFDIEGTNRSQLDALLKNGHRGTTAGPRHGTAVAEALFGVTNPGGKLPFTMPRHVGQVPIHHAQKWGSGYRRTAGDIHKGYLDMPSTPLFSSRPWSTPCSRTASGMFPRSA